MPWTIQNDRPIYLQLMDQIKLRILSGSYQCGEHFPSVRELAAEAAVNPNTMQKALASLEQEGLLIGSRTNGRMVTDDQSLIQTLRSGLADAKYQQFHQSLLELGYSENDITEFLKQQQSKTHI